MVSTPMSLFQRTAQPAVGQSPAGQKTESPLLMHTLFKDSLTGKVALVTGAGSGIGKATAKLFAYAGARVATLTRSRDEAEATCTEIRHGKGEALGIVADISDAGQMTKAI